MIGNNKRSGESLSDGKPRRHDRNAVSLFYWAGEVDAALGLNIRVARERIKTCAALIGNWRKAESPRD